MAKEIKTIKGQMFGDCQALISKAGNAYLKGTIVHDGDDGVRVFVNACFFPDAADLQKMRTLLCKGRMIEATGSYSEREYTGKDGTDKIAHDLLVHEVKVGQIADWNGEKKSTSIGLMDGVTVNDLKPQNKVPEGTKPSKTVTKIEQETDVDEHGIGDSEWDEILKGTNL